MKRVVAIIGGIGSGKSVVSSILRVMGYPVYDCDSEAKKMMANSTEIRNKLVSVFGDSVVSGNAINREFLAGKVFNDKSSLFKLNGIVHPAVKNDFSHWSTQQDSYLVFVESAILFESGMDTTVNAIINITAPLEVRIERVIKRNNTTREAVEARIKSQCKSLPETYIPIYEIDNGGTMALLPQIFQVLIALSHNA